MLKCWSSNPSLVWPTGQFSAKIVILLYLMSQPSQPSAKQSSSGLIRQLNCSIDSGISNFDLSFFKWVEGLVLVFHNKTTLTKVVKSCLGYFYALAYFIWDSVQYFLPLTLLFMPVIAQGSNANVNFISIWEHWHRILFRSARSARLTSLDYLSRRHRLSWMLSFSYSVLL